MVSYVVPLHSIRRGTDVKNREDVFKITRSPANTNWHELKTLAEYYGCEVEDGANHKKIYHPSLKGLKQFLFITTELRLSM